MSDPGPELNDKELIAKVDKWSRILKDEGASGILAPFPAGNHKVANVIIHSDHNGKMEGGRPHGINVSNPLKEIFNNQPMPFDDILSVTQEFTTSFVSHGFPNKDMIAVADLYSLKKTWPKKVWKDEFGVVFKTRLADGFPDSVHYIMLFPRKYLRDFIDDINKRPKFMRDMSKKILDGIGDVVPMQEAESVLFQNRLRENPWLRQPLKSANIIDIPYK